VTNESDVINAVTSVGGMSVLGAISRTILSGDRRSIWGFMRALICASFVALIVGSFIRDYDFKPGLNNFIVGISAFLADDILMLLITIARMVSAKPTLLVDWLITFLTGFSSKKGK
jgi:hypothetical protein